MSEPRPPSDPGRRIKALDALRGFALLGILPINIYQTLHMRDLPAWLDWFVEGRFFVIFSLLFGIGFAIFLDNASTRTDRPRVVLARRLVVLAAFGALHILLQPGEVLLQYALWGLVVLLPLGHASRRINAVVGPLLLAVGTLLVGFAGMVPGLFVIGSALSSYGIPQRLPQQTHRLLVLLAAFVALSVACVWLLQVGGPAFGGMVLVLALPMSFAYMTGFLLVLRTPLGAPLTAALAPFGRMALTNYLMQTVVFVVAGRALGLEDSSAWGTALALTAAILMFQIALSAWWLRTFRYGPLEWLWRCATWGQRVPFHRSDRHAPAAAEPGGR